MAVSQEQLAELLRSVFGSTQLDDATLAALAAYARPFGMEAIEAASATFTEFPRPLDFLAALQRAARAIAVSGSAPTEVEECTCEGALYVTVEPAGPDGPEVVRPCAACLPTAYERWRGGHFGTHLNCAECRNLRPTPRRRKLTRVG